MKGGGEPVALQVKEAFVCSLAVKLSESLGNIILGDSV